MRKTLLGSLRRFGAALSFLAAVSLLSHAGTDHASDPSAANHACAVCRVAQTEGRTPQVSAVPVGFTVTDVPVVASPAATVVSLVLQAGRGPPAL